MRGIYFERDIYEPGQWNVLDLEALVKLGIRFKVHVSGKLEILEDTSEQMHELCDVSRDVKIQVERP